MIGWLKNLFSKPDAPKPKPIRIDLPEGIAHDQLAKLGINHLAQDNPFDGLVAQFQELGLSPENADLAAERIAAGMTRALMFGDKTRPDPDHDPLATAAFDLIKSGQDPD